MLAKFASRVDMPLSAQPAENIARTRSTSIRYTPDTDPDPVPQPEYSPIPESLEKRKSTRTHIERSHQVPSSAAYVSGAPTETQLLSNCRQKDPTEFYHGTADAGTYTIPHLETVAGVAFRNEAVSIRIR